VFSGRRGTKAQWPERWRSSWEAPGSLAWGSWARSEVSAASSSQFLLLCAISALCRLCRSLLSKSSLSSLVLEVTGTSSQPRGGFCFPCRWV
jgi:hypothetical protein